MRLDILLNMLEVIFFRFRSFICDRHHHYKYFGVSALEIAIGSIRLDDTGWVCGS